MKTESQIVRKMADDACRTIAISIRRQMQRMEPSLSSDLGNAWNEVCIQVQGEESIHWDQANPGEPCLAACCETKRPIEMGNLASNGYSYARR
jgi:hypothetical protein